MNQLNWQSTELMLQIVWVRVPGSLIRAARTHSICRRHLKSTSLLNPTLDGLNSLNLISCSLIITPRPSSTDVSWNANVGFPDAEIKFDSYGYSSHSLTNILTLCECTSLRLRSPNTPFGSGIQIRQQDTLILFACTDISLRKLSKILKVRSVIAVILQVYKEQPA